MSKEQREKFYKDRQFEKQRDQILSTIRNKSSTFKNSTLIGKTNRKRKRIETMEMKEKVMEKLMVLNFEDEDNCSDFEMILDSIHFFENCWLLDGNEEAEDQMLVYIISVMDAKQLRRHFSKKNYLENGTVNEKQFKFLQLEAFRIFSNCYDIGINPFECVETSSEEISVIESAFNSGILSVPLIHQLDRPINDIINSTGYLTEFYLTYGLYQSHYNDIPLPIFEKVKDNIENCVMLKESCKFLVYLMEKERCPIHLDFFDGFFSLLSKLDLNSHLTLKSYKHNIVLRFILLYLPKLTDLELKRYIDLGLYEIIKNWATSFRSKVKILEHLRTRQDGLKLVLDSSLLDHCLTTNDIIDYDYGDDDLSGISKLFLLLLDIITSGNRDAILSLMSKKNFYEFIRNQDDCEYVWDDYYIISERLIEKTAKIQEEESFEMVELEREIEWLKQKNKSKNGRNNI